MLLTDEELARLDTIGPFLVAAAREALPFARDDARDYEMTLELAEHLQPGLRIRAADMQPEAGDPDTPPYPLNLYVGLPLDELRALANAGDAERDRELARFGASFAARLDRAINTQTAHEIDLEAGVQSEAGTLAVELENEEGA
jgi:hypothetical protein